MEEQARTIINEYAIEGRRPTRAKTRRKSGRKDVSVGLKSFHCKREFIKRKKKKRANYIIDVYLMARYLDVTANSRQDYK